jgi:hypothetical protein
MSDDDDVPTFNEPDGGNDADDGGGEAAPAPAAVAQARAQRNPDGFGDAEEHDAPGSGPKRRREVSQSTRELFRKASAAVKAQVDAGETADAFEVAIKDEDDPDAAELEAAAVDPATPDPAAAAQTPEQVAAAAAAAAKAPPPALDDRVVKAWEQVNAAQEALAEERRQIAALRAESDYESLRDAFIDKPGATTRDLIKRWAPHADERELRELTIDLITELSGEVLGVTIDTAAQQRLDRRAADRSVKAWRAAQKREQDEKPKKDAAEREAAEERRCVTAIDSELKAAAQQYPFLALEEGAAADVWDRMKKAYAKDRTIIPWQEAAAEVENQLKTQASAWIAPRKHLLAMAPGSPPAPAKPAASVPQGDPSSIRRSRTLTNGSAASAPTAPRRDAAPADQPLDARAHRNRSLGKLAAAIKKQAEAE